MDEYNGTTAKYEAGTFGGESLLPRDKTAAALEMFELLPKNLDIDLGSVRDERLLGK